MIAAISILILAAVIVGVLTYNGVFADKDKDGIPDKVEEAFEDVKEAAKKVKKKVTRKTKKSWDNQNHVNVETHSIQMGIVMELI